MDWLEHLHGGTNVLTPRHGKNVRIRNQLKGNGFQVYPRYLDASNVPHALEPYFEPWRFSLIVVSDGTNQFYRLAKGEGWAVNYVRFKEVPADIDIEIHDEGGENDSPDTSRQINCLAPGVELRTIIVTDRIVEQPGINAVFGITKPDGERIWSVLSLWPIHAT